MFWYLGPFSSCPYFKQCFPYIIHNFNFNLTFSYGRNTYLMRSSMLSKNSLTTRYQQHKETHLVETKVWTVVLTKTFICSIVKEQIINMNINSFYFVIFTTSIWFYRSVRLQLSIIRSFDQSESHYRHNRYRLAFCTK